MKTSRTLVVTIILALVATGAVSLGKPATCLAENAQTKKNGRIFEKMAEKVKDLNEKANKTAEELKPTDDYDQQQLIVQEATITNTVRHDASKTGPADATDTEGRCAAAFTLYLQGKIDFPCGCMNYCNDHLNKWICINEQMNCAAEQLKTENTDINSMLLRGDNVN